MFRLTTLNCRGVLLSELESRWRGGSLGRDGATTCSSTVILQTTQGENGRENIWSLGG
ncbi:uncharacterized protein J3R85_001238 [Psidium guajava]|nr:uncharacterized protein J3R85_001238 [Psidium guajava]